MATLKIIQKGREESRRFDGSVRLSDLLLRFGYAVPHPCGGRGICEKCTVLLNGAPVLACRTEISADAEVVLPDREEIESVVGISDSGRLTESVCLCLDVGTTTLALALVSLDPNEVIRTVTAPNPQRAFGSDVISRIDRCRKHGPKEQQAVLVQALRTMADGLLSQLGLQRVDTMYVTGNTTMLHLLFGVDCASMGVAPYTPAFLSRRSESGETLGLPFVGDVRSLPGISSFVGADIVSGMHFIGLPEAGKYRILLDLGTNAEIALFDRNGILCTAAAAGPCFEGGNISCGMTASPGAICAVSEKGVTVIGGGEAKGLCATGLIDAVAVGLRSGRIDETGYMQDGTFKLCGSVSLSARDVREFQLAKSAIRAATECLLGRCGIGPDRVEGFYVAGGFSGGLNVENAVLTGLFHEALAEKFHGVNNASLLGTVRYAAERETLCLPLENATYADLSADPVFSDLFADHMLF